MCIMKIEEQRKEECTMVENISQNEFQAKTSEGLSLVDFWAPWCGPCRMQGPIVEQLSEERSDVNVYKINVDENQELASQLGIMSIPTMLIIKDGQIVETLVGLRQKQELENVLNTYC